MTEVEMRTIYCDEFIKAFGINEPCCSSCHDEYENEEIPYYECVIGSTFTTLRLPSGEHVMAHLCCAMLHTKEYKGARTEAI